MGQKAAELGTAVPLSARLETRTKESMEFAGSKVLSAKPQGVVKASHPRWCITGARVEVAVVLLALAGATTTAWHVECLCQVYVCCVPVPCHHTPKVQVVKIVIAAWDTGLEVQRTEF